MKNIIICLIGFISIFACNSPKTLEQVKSNYVDVDNIYIHYKTFGHGDNCIVFVHGFGCDMNSWQHQFNYFSDKAKMIFIDLPGYGGSDKRGKNYSLYFFAKAVKAVIDAEKASGDLILVGHSLGTPVCREFIFKYPVTAKKIVDVDGVYCFYPADSLTTAAYISFAESFKGDSLKQKITGFVEALCTPQTPLAVKQYAMSVMPETPEYIAYSTMTNLICEKYWQNKVINIPALVIASVNSQIPPDYKQILSKFYSNMEYHELDSVGHFIMMEKPEMFNIMLEDFINK